MTHFLKIKFVPFLLVIVISSILYSNDILGWDKTYPELAQTLAEQIGEILVEQGECKAWNNCSGKEFLFRGGTANKAIITIYDANELQRETLTKIIDACTDFYVSHNEAVTVELEVYKESRKERYSWFSGSMPFIYLTLKGIKK